MICSKKISSIEKGIKELKQAKEQKIEQIKANASYNKAKRLLEKFEKDENVRSENTAVLQKFKQTEKQIENHPSQSESKSMFDKVFDFLLGNSADDSLHKYALICSRCFSHNGLALERDMNTVTYVCPKCGFLNGPKISDEFNDESNVLIPEEPELDQQQKIIKGVKKRKARKQ